jgi:signal transduction histidine kinase
MSDAISATIETTPAHKVAGRSTVVAWTIWTVVAAVTCLSAWLASDQGGPIVLSPSSVAETISVAIVLVLPYTTIGALIASRRPENATGWVLMAIGVTAAISLLTSSYGNYAHPRNLEFSATIAAVSEVTWLPSLALLVTLLPLLFPTGHPPGRRWRPLIWATGIGLSLFVLSGAVDGWQQRDRVAGGATALDDPTGASLAGFLVSGCLLLVAFIGSLASVAVRFRRATGLEREQLKWILFGFAVTAGVVVVQLLVAPPVVLERLLWYCTLILPATIGIAILRHGLFDIDLLISRALLWTLLSGFVITTYVVVVGALGSQFQSMDNVIWSLLATGMVALLFQPVRDRMQKLVNRFVYGDRDDPYEAVARLGRRLEGIVSPTDVLPAIVESVSAALKLPYVALHVQHGNDIVPAAAFGAPAPDVALVRLPLAYNAEPVGELVLSPRSSGETLTAADIRLLQDLARQIGVAAHAVQLTADLQRSRERLIIAQEEERRRIRNDLHDGLGPVLSGLKLRAETARNLVGDNAEVDALLADIAERTETAVADIRRLVYSLRPPTLDELGFGGAVRSFASQSTIPVVLAMPETLPPLPAAVEVAAFRIIQEALTNVERHAQAASGAITLHLEGNSLIVSIADDGRGLDQDGPRGIGTRSMRERATELGGTIDFECLEAGGTRVTATLPLAADSRSSA